ncbi:hypothetical protein KAJ27_23455, partial [bacterium]|nr:hypothetical protein [bacterium]
MAIPRNFDYKNYDNLRQKSEILKKRDLFLNIVIISFILIISLLLYWALRDNKNIKTVEKKLNKTVTKPQIDKKALEEKKKKDEEIYRKKLAKEKRLKTAST